MKRLFTIFPIVFLLNFSLANNPPDTLLNKVRNSKSHEKLALWEKWYDNPTKENVLIQSNYLEEALKDAIQIIGQDSALIWQFHLQGTLVNNLQTFGSGELGLKILERMKIIAETSSQKKGSPHLALVEWYFYLGHFYYKQVDMVEAEKFFLKGLEINKEVKSIKSEVRLYNILGLMKTFESKFEAALKYYSQVDSISSHPSIPITRKFSLIRNKAYLNNKLGNFAQAHNLYLIALDSIHLFSKSFEYRTKTEYATNLCDLGRVEDCLEYLEYLKLIFEKEDNKATMLTFSERYSDALVLAGRLEEGKYWNKANRSYYYEIQEARRKDEIQEWQAKYEATENETKIKRLEQEKIISQSRFAIFGLIGLFGIGILSFFLYRNRNHKRQLSIQLKSDQQVAENRDRLFSSITHDIRTPLAMMIAPLDRMEKNTNDSTNLSDIKLVKKNGKRLMELFNQILDWNKAESKAFKLNPQVGQLNISIESLCDRFQEQAAEKEIEFSFNLNLPKELFLIDYDKLDKILSNLVSNAIKFCEKGEKVNLSANVDDGPNNENMLNITIIDEGPGVEKKDQSKIFKRFVQGHFGNQKGGSGIGLALVKELVDLMDGRIQLKSELGRGSSFNVMLPIKKVEDKFDLTTSMDDELSSSLVQSDQKPLILIVEDEIDLLQFLKSALSKDYIVEAANSTSTGLILANSRLPEIIISDWVLPDNNGGWLCQQIGANDLTSHIPVIILSAYDDEKYKNEAFEAGAIAWINKPFQLNTLHKNIHSILNQQRRTQLNWKNNEVVKKTITKIGDVVEVQDPFIEKIKIIVQENYSDENFTVEKMAKMLFLSRGQLFRKIKVVTGITPSKMIIEYRLNMARKLIQEDGQSIAEVAYQVGFSDPGYFGKAYKRYFNVAPSKDLE